MDNDPKKAFRIAKKAVMENPTLTNYFAALCSQHSGLEGTKLKRALKLVYKMVLPNVIHSRFAVVFRLWKEMHVQSKDKHALRNVLKVGASNKAKKDSTAKTPKKKTTKVTKKKTTKVPTVPPKLSESKCAMNRKRRIKILFEKKQRKKRKHDSQNNGLLL